MYALSLGVQNINRTLPEPVYALLSGLNASTVGIVALAAVQLAEKAINDRLSRILVIFGACAGLCYNALWYFPVLMLSGGFATALWNGWGYQQIRRMKLAWRNRHNQAQEPEASSADVDCVALGDDRAQTSEETARARRTIERLPQSSADAQIPAQSSEEDPSQGHIIRIRVGVLILVLFFGNSCPSSRKSEPNLTL